MQKIKAHNIYYREREKKERLRNLKKKIVMREYI